MSIDKSGERWIGSGPDDICEYLKAYTADGYQVGEFRSAKCSCGGDQFRLAADDDEGRQEYWADAAPEQWKCLECYSTSANIGVGFSFYEDGEIRWLYVGEGCARCGILGCFAGWKVAYSLSRHLPDQV